MNPPTDEQQLIVDKVGEGKNIIVDAVAGSGKTTTVLWIAKTYPDKTILQLTYNRGLKDEVCEKRDALCLQNLEIQTYHGFASKVFRKSIYNNNKLKEVINDCSMKSYSADILILDEVQDMTPDYFVLANIVKSENLVLLGDPYQMIYKYQGANLEYLFSRCTLWKRIFERLTLSVSFRLTNPMARFMNEVVLIENRFKTVKDGPNVNYLHVNPFEEAAEILCEKINEFLKKGYDADDIFILCPSIKDTTPFNKLLNELSRNNIPIYKSSNDDERLTDSVIKNKVVVSTFHQAKGRERKIVIVYGIDSFLKNMWKDLNYEICPEFIYVALTRAKEHMFIIHALRQVKLPFIKLKLCEIKNLDYVDFIGYTYESNILPTQPKNQLFYVTRMVAHLNSDLEY